jgi:hypothetical protein
LLKKELDARDSTIDQQNKQILQLKKVFEENESKWANEKIGLENHMKTQNDDLKHKESLILAQQGEVLKLTEDNQKLKA